MNLVTTEENESVKPGIYFCIAESPDYNSALMAIQDNLNSPQFHLAHFLQLVVTQKINLNAITKQPEIMHCVVAVIKFYNDEGH